jgi:2-polyprenyl-6-methoxyphenol hydroxylase-like FAD-dependent oxidoreductase
MTARRGRVAVIGAGPAGMAAALSIHQAGHDVLLLERYPQARPAGNILNLWPPPVKALGLLGVDTADLGAPCHTEFRSVSGHTRVRVDLPGDVIQRYAGGFIGLLRPDLYERLLAALPPGVLQVNRRVDRFEQDEAGVRLHMGDGEVIEADLVVGADGIDSLVRRTLWGDAPKREHNLHIFGGFTFDDSVPAERGLCILHHSRTVQGSWSAIRSKGRDGYQWWVLGAHGAQQGFTGDRHATATAMASGFPAPLPQLVAATDPANVQRWVLRDRKASNSGRRAGLPSSATPPIPPARTRPTGPGWPPRTATSWAADWPASICPTTLPSGRRCRISRPRASRTPPARSSRRSSSASSFITPRRRCRPSATRSWTTRHSCRRSWASPRPARYSSS